MLDVSQETYDRVLTDVLMMHSEIARTIAQEVRAKLTPQAETILASGRQVNPDAQEAYLKGKFHMNQGTPEGYQKAVDYLHEAVEHYEKFLNLWKDTYPGIAEVEDARERVAGLKGLT